MQINTIITSYFQTQQNLQAANKISHKPRQLSTLTVNLCGSPHGPLPHLPHPARSST